MRNTTVVNELDQRVRVDVVRESHVAFSNALVESGLKTQAKW
jgi:hypothetical protein